MGAYCLPSQSILKGQREGEETDIWVASYHESLCKGRNQNGSHLCLVLTSVAACTGGRIWILCRQCKGSASWGVSSLG